jgi:hypothetical protein
MNKLWVMLILYTGQLCAYDKYEYTHEDIIYTEVGHFIYLDEHLYSIGRCEKEEEFNFSKDFIFIEGHPHKLRHSAECPICLKVNLLD